MKRASLASQTRDEKKKKKRIVNPRLFLFIVLRRKRKWNGYAYCIYMFRILIIYQNLLQRF